MRAPTPRGPRSDRAGHSLVGPEPLPGPGRHGAGRGLGPLRRAQHPPGCHPRSLRCPGHRQDELPRPGAPGGRGPGDLPHHHRAAGRDRGRGRARLLHVRRLLRVRRVSGRDRPLLGAIPGAGAPQSGQLQPPGGGPSRARPRCHRGGLGLPVRPGGPHGPARPGAAAQPPGLVSEVRAAVPAGGVRGRHGRWDGQAVPGGDRPRDAARPQAAAHDPDADHPERQRRGGRRCPGDGRGALHDPRRRLPPRGRGPAQCAPVSPRFRQRQPDEHGQYGQGGAHHPPHGLSPGGHRRDPPGPGDARGHRGARRPGRGGRRNRPDAPGRQCAQHHRGGQDQARRAGAEPAGRGRAGGGL